MGRVLIDEDATFPIFWFCYTSNKLTFEAALQIYGDMYSVFCHARGFRTGLQPGNYWDGLAAMERFLIDTTLDPMAVIAFRANRKLEAANFEWDKQLNRLRRRAAETNAAQQLEANFMAFALERSSYVDALRIHNNLIKLHSNEQQTNRGTAI